MYYKKFFYSHKLLLRFGLAMLVIIGLLQCECVPDNPSYSPKQQQTNKDQSDNARSKTNEQGSTEGPSGPLESDEYQKEQSDKSSKLPEENGAQQDHAPGQDNQQEDTSTPTKDDLSDKMIEDVTDSFLKDTLKALKAGNKQDLDKLDQNYARTPLMVAVIEPKNNVEILKYLLSYGKGDINAATDWGITALHWAMERDTYKPEVAKFLLEQHANLVAKDKSGRTPIQNAIESHNLEGVKVLVEAGVDCNAECEGNGYRPLHTAAGARDLAIIQYLLSKEADKNLLNSKGKKPYECAWGSDTAIKALLQ